LSRRLPSCQACPGGRATFEGELVPERSGPTGYRSTLTIMGTTDLHGNVFNWDYYRDSEYDDYAHNDVGLAKVASLVRAVRSERGRSNTLLVDAGDTIQGTQLAYYYARVEPITRSRLHPMAAAMNEIGFDAAVLGNHEFNYGIPLLATFAEQLDFPLLGANALDAATGAPAFPPYVIIPVRPAGAPLPLRVGVLGLTNPGIAIWDKSHVEGRMTFPDLVETAAAWVPAIRAAGADVVVVAAHSGADVYSSYGDALPYPENASGLVAAQVPGIDAILVGHSHVEIPERIVTNAHTGQPVVLTQPAYWGMRLSLIELELSWSALCGWRVGDRRARVLDSRYADEDVDVVRLLKADHDKVLTYVAAEIGRCTEPMSAAAASYEDTPILDLVNHVQARAVKEALAGSADAHLPVLSSAAPFRRQARIPAGAVSVRDIAGLYLFDNTLLAIRVSGAQVLDYLEKSAEYFRPLRSPGPHRRRAVTNAPTVTAPKGTADHNYDVVAGLDAPLAYDIDLARPVGQRIARLTYAGEPVGPDQEFVLALNSYRQSGGGNFPHVSTAEVLDNRQVEVRQLLIEYVASAGTLDPATFASTDWRLVVDGAPVMVVASERATGRRRRAMSRTPLSRNVQACAYR
jgi:2',3'-cyclic-nucleotide 2'-phosphodiesterase / 3'-nucleotidase